MEHLTTILDYDHSFGNIKPWQDVLKQIRQGKKKTIAFLGASVSTGDLVGIENSYVTYLKHHWNEEMACEYAPYIYNGSHAGTLSTNGLFFVEDILSHKPDLVFLDYSVNDSGLEVFNESFEGLLRKFLRLNIPVATIMFTNNRGDTKYTMKNMSQYYHLPVLEIGNAILQNVDKDLCTWEDLFLDYVHPNPLGHEYIAKNMFDFFHYLEKAPEEKMMPVPSEPMYYGLFDDYEVLTLPLFQEEFEISTTYSVGMVEYKEMPDSSLTAECDIYLDHKYFDTLRHYNPLSWENRVAKILSIDGEETPHTITIKKKSHAPLDEEWDDYQIKLLFSHDF